MDRLISTGKLKTYRSDEVEHSKFGIGLEKLDRALFDPAKTYDKLQKIGVKYVRLQSGWKRTEQKEGVYDFFWLDEVVDNLLKRGMKPWLCLCYGNGLYSPAANDYFGAVGVPPAYTEREKKGWANYCKALSSHFVGRVYMYEVWNEPDGQECWKTGPDGNLYGKFVIETARAVRAGDKNAKIAAGSIASARPPRIKWFENALRSGMCDVIDAVTYHQYRSLETSVPETVRVYRAMINRYNPKVKLIQGESGCPSKPNGHGALCRGTWSEEKQAKMLLRRLITDMKTEVEFSSWFTAVDMVEALNGASDDKKSHMDYGYFGVLNAEFDEDGRSTGEYTEKPSYYAFKNLCGLFGTRGAEYTELPINGYWNDYTERVFGFNVPFHETVTAGFQKENGSCAFFYYKPTDLMTTVFEGVVSFFAVMPHADIRLVDPMSGDIYKIPDTIIEDLGSGVKKFNFLPIKDYPLALTFGNFFEKE